MADGPLKQKCVEQGAWRRGAVGKGEMGRGGWECTRVSGRAGAQMVAHALVGGRLCSGVR